MSEETEVKVDPRDDVRQSFLPLYRWFVRQITYILRRPLHALVTAGSILVFVLLVGYALIKTQQGRPLTTRRYAMVEDQLVCRSISRPQFHRDAPLCVDIRGHRI